MLMKQICQKSVIFVTIGILNILVSNMNYDAIKKIHGSNLDDKRGVL